MADTLNNRFSKTDNAYFGLKVTGGIDWSWDQIAVYLHESRDGKVFIAKPLEFAADEEAAGSRPDPTFRLPNGTAQQLFDMLWREGFRPKDGTGNAGHTMALSNHLEDMRRLVFKDAPK